MCLRRSTLSIFLREHTCCSMAVQLAVWRYIGIKPISQRREVYYGYWIIQGQNSEGECYGSGLVDHFSQDGNSALLIAAYGTVKLKRDFLRWKNLRRVRIIN